MSQFGFTANWRRRAALQFACVEVRCHQGASRCIAVACACAVLCAYVRSFFALSCSVSCSVWLSSIVLCFAVGMFKRGDMAMLAFFKMKRELNGDDDETDPDEVAETLTDEPQIKKRRQKPEGTVHDPANSLWGQMLRLGEYRNENTRAGRDFKNRFRCTPDEYHTLVNLVNDENWRGLGIGYRPAAPLDLLVLGVLRYLGRAVTFDCLEEMTQISAEVHRTFLHIFVAEGMCTVCLTHISPSALTFSRSLQQVRSISTQNVNPTSEGKA